MILLLAAALAGPVVVPAHTVDEARAGALFHGRRLALLVGPESWDDPGFAPLQFTDDDARALEAVLSDPDRGAFDRVWTLTRRGDTGADDVRAAMAELAAASTSSDDVVFVYFSTHGTLSRDAGGALRQHLVLADTEVADVAGTGLSHAELMRWLESLTSRRKVLLLATCHSGQGKSAYAPALQAELASTKGAPLVPFEEVSEAVMVLAASGRSETARESAVLGHDIYTWFFLEALSSGDLDGDGAVTATEAHERARAKTYAFTAGAQRPYALAEVLGTDPIVLVGRRGEASASVLGSYRARLDGHTVFVDGLAKGELPGVVAVPPGAHRIEVRAPGDRVVTRQRVLVEAGRPFDVSELVRQDALRFGIGAAAQAAGEPGVGGGALTAEVHLPRWPGAGWELLGHGSAVLRWPHPTLEGGLELERAILPGTVQLRAGGGLQGFLLGAPGEPPLLAPSLVPVPVVSLAWLPSDPAFARLSVSGGYLWYTDRGAWRHGWTARAALVVGAGY